MGSSPIFHPEASAYNEKVGSDGRTRPPVGYAASRLFSARTAAPGLHPFRRWAADWLVSTRIAITLVWPGRITESRPTPTRRPNVGFLVRPWPAYSPFDPTPRFSHHDRHAEHDPLAPSRGRHVELQRYRWGRGTDSRASRRTPGYKTPGWCPRASNRTRRSRLLPAGKDASSCGSVRNAALPRSQGHSVPVLPVVLSTSDW